MSLRRHTVMAIFVIAAFVALQAIFFFGNYFPSGTVRTEAQAIAVARYAGDCNPPIDGPWRAVLWHGVWVAHVEMRDGWTGRLVGATAQVDIDARNGKILECRFGIVD